MKDNAGKVRVVYMNMVVHPKVVTRAHLAGCAAAKQGKFLAFKNAWWELAYKKKQFDDAAIERVASSVQIDVDKLKADMDSEGCKERVSQDMAALRVFGVSGTPNFFFNGHHVGGAIDKAAMQNLVDNKLKEVEASGVPAAEYYDKVIMATGEKKFRTKDQPKP